MSDTQLGTACRQWRLRDAEMVADTPSSRIFRVRRDEGVEALKLLKPYGADEIGGAPILRWWDGDGAVRLLDLSDDAMLLNWVEGEVLGDRVRKDGDGDSAVGLAALLVRLHRVRPGRPEDLDPLEDRLNPMLDGRFGDLARHLLATAPPSIPLHGDFHHDNILIADEGWVAIDPKGVFGDPAYDCANLFLNPVGAHEAAQKPDRILRLAEGLSAGLGYPLPRILGWAVVHSALAIAWAERSGGDPAASPAIQAALVAALAELGGELSTHIPNSDRSG